MNPVLLLVVLLVGVGLGTLVGSSLIARRAAAAGAPVAATPARSADGPPSGDGERRTAAPGPAEPPAASVLPPPPALSEPAPMAAAPGASAGPMMPAALSAAAVGQPAPAGHAAPPAHPAAPAAMPGTAASMAGRDLWTAPHADLADEVAKVPRRRREDFLPESDRPAAETLPQAELPPGWTDPITGLPLAEAMRADIELRATDFRTFSVVVCHPMMAMTTPGGMVNVSPNAGYGEEELRVFASVLRDTLRQKDIVGRYDERLFLLFLPRCKVEEVRIVMDRIRGNLLSAQPNQPQWVDISYGAAAGEVGHSVDGPLKVAYADLLHRNAGPAWFMS